MRRVVRLGWATILMPAFAQTHVATTIGDLPVGFEPNVGQTDSQVRFLARTPGTIVFFTPTQLGIQIPFEAAGALVTVSVSSGGQASASATVMLAAVAPGIFMASQDGKGAGAVTHVDGSAVTTQNPAHAGELVILYAT